MTSGLLDVFRKVLHLAEKRRLAEPNEESVIDLGEIDLESISESEEECNLRLYLESLDYETIKTLQVIMYLGRDGDYYKNDTPEEILRKQREYFDARGWNSDKDIEVNQMVEKLPLDEYLRAGLRILNVNL